MGILECISGAVRELFGATDEITKDFLLPQTQTGCSPTRARNGVVRGAELSEPPLRVAIARCGGRGEMGVLALYEQTPSRRPRL